MIHQTLQWHLWSIILRINLKPKEHKKNTIKITQEELYPTMIYINSLDFTIYKSVLWSSFFLIYVVCEAKFPSEDGSRLWET